METVEVQHQQEKVFIALMFLDQRLGDKGDSTLLMMGNPLGVCR